MPPCPSSLRGRIGLALVRLLNRALWWHSAQLKKFAQAAQTESQMQIEVMGELERRWPGLLGRLITRRMPMERYAEAVEPERDGVKTVIEVAPA